MNSYIKFRCGTVVLLDEIAAIYPGTDETFQTTIRFHTIHYFYKIFLKSSPGLTISWKKETIEYDVETGNFGKIIFSEDKDLSPEEVISVWLNYIETNTTNKPKETRDDR